MTQKLYMTCAGVFALAMLACSESMDSPVSGTAEEPNVLMAENDLSSSSLQEDLSSSSVVAENPASSAETPVSSAETPASSAEILEISSSSKTPEQSSSSSEFIWNFSSAYIPPVLCKVGGYGCAISYYGDLWSGEYEYWDDKSEADVQTSLYAEDKSQFGINAGKWFLEADSTDGGKSTIQWKVAVGVEGDSTSILPVVEECGNGLCGTFNLDKGDLDYDPFVQVGFNVAGFDSNGVALAADVSNWQGICIMYSTDVYAVLELSMSDSLNSAMNYALPAVDLGKSYGTSKCFEWSDFRQPSWKRDKDLTMSGEDAARQLVSVIIRIQGKTGRSGNFSIGAVGSNRPNS